MLHTIFILHPTILTFHKRTKYLNHNQRSKVSAKQKHRIDCDCRPMLQLVKWWMEISKGIKLANCSIARSILILDVEIIPILILRARFLINQKLRNLLTNTNNITDWAVWDSQEVNFKMFRPNSVWICTNKIKGGWMIYRKSKSAEF